MRIHPPHSYILVDRTPVPEPDIVKWAKWYGTADRHVGEDFVGPIRVSTVFLGLNHRFGPGRPLLFETMLFADDDYGDLACRRYSTWADAERGHQVALRYARRLVNRVERATKVHDPTRC